MRALSIVALACIPGVSSEDRFLKARLSAQMVAEQLRNELQVMLGHGSAESTSRLERFEAQMRPMYMAMSKRADGTMEHAAARYALHRFFVQQHGWHVKGLEATGAEKWGDSASTSMLEDRVPSYVLELFEQQREGRMGLRELAVLAATLEDLVHSEAIELLSTSYAAQSLSIEDHIDNDAEGRVKETYLLFHIMPNPRYASLSTDSLNRILAKAPKFYTGWLDTVLWVQDLQGAMDHAESSRRNPFVKTEAITHDFNSVTRLVEGIGANYGQFQNLECQALKNDLLELSDGSGRVRLSKFYGAAFHNTSQHFSERPEYLRHLGVLDETDPQQPSVIITNYMYSRANCLASSSFYAICCINECERLMAGLEHRLASPTADPSTVAKLVASMASDTVAAPRNLSTTLMQRLDDIAARHEGSIPIHGRLFSQWMHHAFPNECPYPHLAGSLATPMTPSEWLHADGEVKRAIKATPEQMQSFIIADVIENVSESIDLDHAAALLPWTEEEELVVALPEGHSKGGARSYMRFGTLAMAMASIVVALAKMLGAAPTSALSGFSFRGQKDSAWWQHEQKSQYV